MLKITPALILKFVELGKIRYFKKGEFVLREGETCKHIYFILKGLTKSTHVIKDNKEVISWFYAEGDLTTIYNSYLYETPSEEAIQAIENTWILQLP